jgi:MoxR-like ATPase
MTERGPIPTPAADATSLERAMFEVKRVIVGQERMVERMMVSLLARGHCLLEGVPGVAKTLAVETLAHTVSGSFARLQFTPDLVPSDIVGTRIYRPGREQFDTELGPVFANFVLADEINRAPAKVQSALLEGMQERRATIGLQTHDLPAPFVVLATMNPYDADGTYPLPLAQLDRFLAKLVVPYPSREEERAIVDRFGGAEPPLRADVATLADVTAWQAGARAVFVDAKVRDYAVDVVRASRGAELVAHGASPRAALALVALARARAYLEERSFATPDDVRDLAPAVLRHRIAYDDRIAIAGGDPEEVVRRIVATVPAP